MARAYSSAPEISRNVEERPTKAGLRWLFRAMVAAQERRAAREAARFLPLADQAAFRSAQVNPRASSDKPLIGKRSRDFREDPNYGSGS